MLRKILHPKVKVLWMLGICFITIVLPSFKSIRGLIATPLYVSEPNPKSDIAYVMSDGHAYWERLHGASDLYHMQCIKRIYVRDERVYSHYNFVKNRSDYLAERAIDYLVWRGVPRDAIATVPVSESSSLGSLGEARMIASLFPDIDAITVVTSAPHTRRTLLSFRRSLKVSTKVYVYSPSNPAESAEIAEPLWLEYAKLIAYYLIA